MKKILIFKSDKIGDILNISPVLKNIKLNFPHVEITIVCSSYNSPITKYYPQINRILIYKKPFFIFLLKNFKHLLITKYDLILQLDGKNDSYLSSIFIRSTKKVAIKFIKNKKKFGLNFITSRPGFFVSLFFNFFSVSNENYNHVNNKKFHYSTLYLSLLEMLNITVTSKKHFLPYKPDESLFHADYFHLHIDERWSSFDSVYCNKFKEKIKHLSLRNKIVITSNLGGNNFFNNLMSSFLNFENISFKNNASINELINIIYYSHTVISSHTGFIVHVGASFEKKIIDIVHSNIHNELDRWIPFECNYTRFKPNEFLEKEI